MERNASTQGGFFLGAARAFRRDAPACLQAMARGGGDVVRFRLAATRAALVTAPALIEEVMIARADRFAKPRALGMGRLFFGQALTALDGDAWRARRKIVAPVFQPAAMDDAIAIAARRGQAAVARWTGAATRVDDHAMALALGVVTETLIGADVDEDRDGARLGAAVARALRGVAVRMQRGWALPDWLPTPSARAMRGGMREVRGFVARALAQRGDHGLAARLATAALSPDAARDELAVSLCLGAHQVALALAWTLHLLATHPDAQAEIAAEVDAVLGARPARAADLPRLRRTRNAVLEALRLYPPFYALVRAPIAAIRIGDHALAANTLVFVSPWVCHRDPRWFDAPERFWPARWDGGLERRLPRFAYFPFGGGPRVCPAHRMVPAQVVAMLASVMQTAVVRPVRDHVVAPAASVSLGFAHGLRLEVAARTTARAAAEVAS